MARFGCTRRDFLKRSAAGLLGLSLPVSSSIADENEKDTITLSSGPHVFLDDYLIEAQHNFTRKINQPSRLSEPIVTAEGDGCFQPYVEVIRSPETGKFRIWYGVPESASQTHLATMESDDGIHWKRPHKVLEDPAFIQFGTSIIDEGSECSDPEKRYKYGWYSPEGGLRIAVSPDGLKWKPLTPGVVLEFNHDIVEICRDPIRNRYMALHSSYSEGANWEGRRRIVMESISSDLLRWQRSWRIIEPDKKDEGKTEFYGLSGPIARGSLLVGMLKVLRDDLIAEGAPENAYGIGYTVLAWSRDGIHWERDREAFLPRNPIPGTWDHAMAWGDCQLVVGNEIYIYYGGYKWGHKYERFTQRQIGLARIPIDRYVSREAGKEKGILRTRKALLHGRLITVNANVTGELKVRILNSSGKTIRGFDYSDFLPIQGDSLAHVLEWKGGKMPLRKEPLQLEFALRNGKLYGFTLKDKS
jgi:hypothetical protein